MPGTTPRGAVTIALEHLRKAFASLDAGLAAPPRSDLERDGVIQRFEYTFELAWKVAARALKAAGVDAQSPKAVIRELGRQGWIAGVETWLEFLEARNQSTHTYQSKTAEQVYAAARAFAPECRALIARLDTETR